MITSPALVAASRVTSWSPAKAEIVGHPFSIKLTCDVEIHWVTSRYEWIYSWSYHILILYLNGLSVVRLHHVEIEAVHPSAWSEKDAALLVEMTTNVHQDLTKTSGLNRYALKIKIQFQLFVTHLVEVDDHGAVAHICGLMVGLACGGEGHAAGTWAHWHPQCISRWLRGGRRVADHQTLALQYYGLRVVLSSRH